MSFWKKLFGSKDQPTTTPSRPDPSPAQSAAPAKASVEPTSKQTMTDKEVLTQVWNSMMCDDDAVKVLSILRQSKHQAILSLTKEYEQAAPEPLKNYNFRQKIENIMRQQFGMTRW